MQKNQITLHFHIFIFLGFILSISPLAEERRSARLPPEYTLQTPSLLNHLSSTTVLSTLYASDGYLWLATLDGIRRVEQQGDQTFHHYRNFIGESERLRARKILEIWDGELLALTLENRLTSLTRDSSEFQSAYRLKNIGVSIEEVVDAYFSASNHLWLGYANGHITLIESNNQYQQIFSELDAGAPTDIFGYGDGHALVSYREFNL